MTAFKGKIFKVLLPEDQCGISYVEHVLNKGCRNDKLKLDG
jgi:hypothetical protein